MARMAGIASRAEELLDVGVVSTTPVAGGDICTTTRLRLTDGRSAVVKTRPNAPAGFFLRESEGLRWLASANGAKVPKVLGASEDCIILEWVGPGRRKFRLPRGRGGTVGARRDRRRRLTFHVL